jgi:hypothetical protein
MSSNSYFPDAYNDCIDELAMLSTGLEQARLTNEEYIKDIAS